MNRILSRRMWTRHTESWVHYHHGVLIGFEIPHPDKGQWGIKIWIPFLSFELWWFS
jgi:hypothetical protein